MQYSTVAAVLRTVPFIARMSVRAELLRRLWPLFWKVLVHVEAFLKDPIDPKAALRFENGLREILREFGRIATEFAYNAIEPPAAAQMPMRCSWEGEEYRRFHKKTPNRHVATLFGTITVWRFLYTAVEVGVGSIVPLELRLGILPGAVTLALAARVGQFAVDHGQRDMLELLLRHHGVRWGVGKLRHVLRVLRDGLAPHLHDARVLLVLELLRQAHASRGSRKPVLVVGRDGIFLSIRNHSEQKEGSSATVSIYDRRGKRLGTVYFGRMPEALQLALTQQLTAVIVEVLRRWDGPLPALVYITDAGHHPTEYFHKVLRRMRNPRRPGQRLKWQWIVDYYHAASRITTLAEAIFGPGREAQAWAAKMRKLLKEKPGGIQRVLHSAAALRHHRGLAGKDSDYQTAYDYLRGRTRFLDYAGYRRRQFPIGSGVTEAACKTVFTQRLKRAGMTWGIEGGQVILDLRVLELSGIWEATVDRWLAALPRFDTGVFPPPSSSSPALRQQPLQLVA